MRPSRPMHDLLTRGTRFYVHDVSLIRAATKLSEWLDLEPGEVVYGLSGRPLGWVRYEVGQHPRSLRCCGIPFVGGDLYGEEDAA